MVRRVLNLDVAPYPIINRLHFVPSGLMIGHKRLGLLSDFTVLVVDVFASRQERLHFFFVMAWQNESLGFLRCRQRSINDFQRITNFNQFVGLQDRKLNHNLLHSSWQFSRSHVANIHGDFLVNDGYRLLGPSRRHWKGHKNVRGSSISGSDFGSDLPTSRNGVSRNDLRAIRDHRRLRLLGRRLDLTYIACLIGLGFACLFGHNFRSSRRLGVVYLLSPNRTR